MNNTQSPKTRILKHSATDPRNADARFQLAQTCETQGRTVEALAHYGEVIRIDAQHLNGHLRAGQAAASSTAAFMMPPPITAAFSNSRRYIQPPWSAWPHIAISGRTTRRRGTVAADRLRASPRFRVRTSQLGTRPQSAGDFSNAAASFQRATELAPQTAESYTELAAVYEKLGQAADAETTYRRALANSWPPTAPSGMAWDCCYSLDERNSEAADCFRAALEINPEFPQAANNLGLRRSINLAIPRRQSGAVSALPDAVPQVPRCAEQFGARLSGRGKTRRCRTILPRSDHRSAMSPPSPTVG